MLQTIFIFIFFALIWTVRAFSYCTFVSVSSIFIFQPFFFFLCRGHHHAAVSLLYSLDSTNETTKKSKTLCGRQYKHRFDSDVKTEQGLYSRSDPDGMILDGEMTGKAYEDEGAQPNPI